ncbi:hypothetical protein IAT38_003529 [Cryptococcus sp. DSM 104549]
MDHQQPLPQGDGNSLLNHSAEDPRRILSAIFPVPGAMRQGVSISQRLPLSAPAMSQEDLERHQRPASGATPDGQYNITSHGAFPMGGPRPPWVPEAATSTPMGYQQLLEEQQRQMSAAGPSRSQVHGQGSPHSNSRDNDPVSSFLSEMPTGADDPTRHVLWTELIRLKTRSLELQIAEARRREKEAELELVRLQSAAAARTEAVAVAAGAGGGGNAVAGPSGGVHGGGDGMAGSSAGSTQQQQQQTQQQHQQQQNQQLQDPFLAMYGVGGHNPNAVSPFDLDAMLQNDNTNFLSWLPDFGGGDEQSAPLPNQADNSSMPFGSTDPSSSEAHRPSTSAPAPPVIPSPQRRSHSPSHSPPPAAKRTKRASEKKHVVEQSSACTSCAKPLARVMIRGLKSHIPSSITISIKCAQCSPVNQPTTVPDMGQGTAVSGAPIGTVETRKRMRASMEIDDEEAKVKEKRVWCDVCQRVVGSGQMWGGKDQENSVTSMAEIVCTGCDSKYQRCTDCGGGGGARVGIGKWRMKQVFHPGRKTCSLSHTRLGDRVRELGVHVTPTDFTPEQLKEVITRCKSLWNEKTLSRLAIPEMLEVDLPSSLSNPLRDYADVDDIVTRNWPSREAMIRADGLDPNRFKRLLALIWAHAKPRRSARSAVDLEEEYAKHAEENEDGDMSTVLANVKKTNVVIPAGSELIGMWGGEWDMTNGSLLISTFIPFEGTDGEDSTALSVGEMITKVQNLQQSINAERTAQALAEKKTPILLPPCEHLWTVSGGYIPLVRERFADILIRKRAFVHVEEYLTRHPKFIESIKARPVGLHPDIHRSLPDVHNDSEDDQQPARPLILVRWLGKEFDAQKILEIKQMEFGGGKKVKKSKTKT